MQALYESRLATISKLVEANNRNRTEPREQVDIESMRQLIFLKMSSAHTNQTLSEQEFDLISFGLVIIALARAESTGKTLTPYLSQTNKTLSSPRLNYFLIQCGGSLLLPDTLIKSPWERSYHPEEFYQALQIGYNILNRKYTVDLEAMATNCRTVFSETMADTDLVALESWVRSRVIPNEFVPSVCLASVDPMRQEGSKSLAYIEMQAIAASFDSKKYPGLKQALVQWLPELVPSLEERIDEKHVVYTLKYLKDKLNELDTQSTDYVKLDSCIKDLKFYAGKTANSNEFILQVQKISAEYCKRRELFETERDAFIKQAKKQLSNIVTNMFESEFIREVFPHYLHNHSYFTLDNLQTEKAIMNWGLLVLTVMLHTQQHEMLPYLTLDGNSMNPTYEELKALLKFEDLEVSSDRNDFYYNHDMQARKIAAFIFLIGKKIYNGEIAINRENIQKNIQRMGKEYYMLENNLPVNLRQDRPVYSKGLTQLVQGGEMHAIELFEEAVTVCADSDKAELRSAVLSLWQESLNTYRFPQTKKNFLKADAEILTRYDLFVLAQHTLELAKTADVHAFEAGTKSIRKTMHNSATFIYRLDAVIQAAIGLCVGLVVGLACSTVLPAMAVGVCVGLASTRFGLWHQKEYQAYHKADVALEEVSKVALQ